MRKILIVCFHQTFLTVLLTLTTSQTDTGNPDKYLKKSDIHH